MTQQAHTRQPPKILLVEDHPDMAEVLSFMLKQLGYTHVVADSVAGGVAAADREHFDLVMSDFRLPDGDATDLLSQLNRKAPVCAILLTAFDPQDLSARQRQGFVRCLQKTIGRKDMGEAIAAALAQPAGTPGGAAAHRAC